MNEESSTDKRPYTQVAQHWLCLQDYGFEGYVEVAIQLLDMTFV